MDPMPFLDYGYAVLSRSGSADAYHAANHNIAYFPTVLECRISPGPRLEQARYVQAEIVWYCMRILCYIYVTEYVKNQLRCRASALGAKPHASPSLSQQSTAKRGGNSQVYWPGGLVVGSIHQTLRGRRVVQRGMCAKHKRDRMWVGRPWAIHRWQNHLIAWYRQFPRINKFLERCSIWNHAFQ